MSQTDPSRSKPGDPPAPDLQAAAAGQVTPFRILLLDVDPARRLRRVRAFAAKGAKVDDVSTASQARSRWHAGSHDMVLIDFQGARSEFDDFCDHLQATPQPQKVAYYIAEPPYLTHSRPKVPIGGPSAITGATDGAGRTAVPRQPRQRSFGEAVKDAERQAGVDPS